MLKLRLGVCFANGKGVESDRQAAADDLVISDIRRKARPKLTKDTLKDICA